MNWLTAHFVLMASAFATFWVSVVIGSTYLFQEHRLKSHRTLPVRLNWLPALEVMDGLHYKFLTLGFILLSLGMLAGAVLNKQVFGAFFRLDARQISALVTWAIYASFLNIRIQAGWRGRRGIFLSLVGFATVALAFLALHHRGT